MLCVVDTHKKCLSEKILMSTNSLVFYLVIYVFIEKEKLYGIKYTF